MTDPDIHFAISIALSFVAGAASAVWLAVLLNRGAREMKERTDETEHP
jgi:pyrimidine operon attenuation protein/uracil phosphoribosyltransferase